MQSDPLNMSNDLLKMVGIAFKKIREQSGHSQEALAGNITNRETISNIENGKQIPRLAILVPLLERMGTSLNRFLPYVLGIDDHEFFALREQVNFMLMDDNADQVPALMEKLQATPKFQKDRLRRQFYYSCMAVVGLQRGDETEDIRKHLKDAIMQTIPNFDEDNIDVLPLSGDEVEIMVMMSELYEQEGQMDQAIALLQKLMQNIRRLTYDINEKARSLAVIARYLSSYLGMSGKYKEALAVCDEAIETSHNGRVYEILPLLALNRACSLFYIGKEEEAKTQAQLAYYTSIQHGSKGVAKHIKDTIFRRLGFEIKDV